MNRTKNPVDEYLARVPAGQRAALEGLRRNIRAAAPEATEGMAWGMPAFRQRVWLVGYAAFKEHLSFFSMSAEVIRRNAAALKGFKTTKGTIHFTQDRPLPARLVARIVKARLAETQKKPARRP